MADRRARARINGVCGSVGLAIVQLQLHFSYNCMVVGAKHIDVEPTPGDRPRLSSLRSLCAHVVRLTMTPFDLLSGS